MLAALRGGLTTVLIPKENEKDLDDIPDNVKKDLTIISVESMDDILKHALVAPLIPIEWTDADGSGARRARRGRRHGRERPTSPRRPRGTGPTTCFLSADTGPASPLPPRPASLPRIQRVHPGVIPRRLSGRSAK